MFCVDRQLPDSSYVIPSRMRDLAEEGWQLHLSREDFRSIILPGLRGTATGTVVGILPEVGAQPAEPSGPRFWESGYQSTRNALIEVLLKGLSRRKARTTQALKPLSSLLTLGTPANATMAMMAEALILPGLFAGGRLTSYSAKQA